MKEYSEYQKTAQFYLLDINVTKSDTFYIDCCISGFHAKAGGGNYNKLSTCVSKFYNEVLFETLQAKCKEAIKNEIELPYGIYYNTEKDIYKCDFGCGTSEQIALFLGYEYKCFYNRRTECICGITLTKLKGAIK